jgi:hypothetical protein
MTEGVMQGMFWEVQNSNEVGEIEKSRKFYSHLKGASEWVSGLLNDARNICDKKVKY